MDVEFIAHKRESDGKIQTVYEHLNEVAAICSLLTSKIDLPEAGRLLGLLHDFGKYSHDFQNYIKSATDLLDPDHCCPVNCYIISSSYAITTVPTCNFVKNFTSTNSSMTN